MPFIGNAPSNNFVSLKRQDITGDGTASYTLDYKVASVNDVLIYVNHVKQDPSSYTISGTSLTMGGTVASTDDFYIIYLGQGLQTVTPADNTITTAMLQDDAVTDAKINASLGKVLQVVSVVKEDVFSWSGTTAATDVTGLSASITPASTSNKVLVLLCLNIFSSGSTGGPGMHMKMLRGTTVITSSSAGGGADTADGFVSGAGGGMSANNRRIDTGNLSFLDSPSTTSATTYKVQGVAGNTSDTFYVNRWGLNADQASVSTLTLMEIAG